MFIFTIVFFAGCTTKSIGQINKLPAINIEPCEKIQNIKEKDACYGNLAIKENDFVICDKMDDQYGRDFCYTQASRKRNDFYLACEKVRDLTLKDLCYLDGAGDTGNYTICENVKVQDARDSCYTVAAFAKKDNSICEKIKTTNKKELCFNLIKIIEPQK